MHGILGMPAHQQLQDRCEGVRPGHSPSEVCCELYAYHVEKGQYVLNAHHAQATLWHIHALKKIMNLKDVDRTVGHQCQWRRVRGPADPETHRVHVQLLPHPDGPVEDMCGVLETPVHVAGIVCRPGAGINTTPRCEVFLWQLAPDCCTYCRLGLAGMCKRAHQW